MPGHPLLSSPRGAECAQRPHPLPRRAAATRRRQRFLPPLLDLYISIGPSVSSCLALPPDLGDGTVLLSVDFNIHLSRLLVIATAPAELRQAHSNLQRTAGSNIPTHQKPDSPRAHIVPGSQPPRLLPPADAQQAETENHNQKSPPRARAQPACVPTLWVPTRKAFVVQHCMVAQADD